MTAFWTDRDFDEHELVSFVHDRKSGLNAIIALLSTYLGPGAGGTRFWHYAQPDGALRDALRLSRGMSYKNAMAGLPMGGGKAVVLLDAKRTKTPEMRRMERQDRVEARLPIMHERDQLVLVEIGFGPESRHLIRPEKHHASGG